MLTSLKQVLIEVVGQPERVEPPGGDNMMLQLLLERTLLRSFRWKLDMGDDVEMSLREQRLMEVGSKGESIVPGQYSGSSSAFL